MSDNAKKVVAWIKDIIVVGAVIVGIIAGYLRLEAQPDYREIKVIVEENRRKIEELKEYGVSLERYKVEYNYTNKKLDDISKKIEEMSKRLEHLSIQVAGLKRHNGGK